MHIHLKIEIISNMLSKVLWVEKQIIETAFSETNTIHRFEQLLDTLWKKIMIQF